jgi:hypothetical protein
VSRVIVFNRLAADPELQDMGINGDRIFPTHSIDGTPANGLFLILRWEEQSIRLRSEDDALGPVILTVWAHRKRSESSDFNELKNVLERVKTILLPLHDVREGAERLTGVRYSGASGDLVDGGYNTITLNMAFEVL